MDWLEEPDSFVMLNGSSRRLAIGMKHSNKKTALSLMLVVLHSKGFPRFVSSGDSLGKRFASYLKNYKEALAMKHDAGAGLQYQSCEQV